MTSKENENIFNKSLFKQFSIILLCIIFTWILRKNSGNELISVDTLLLFLLLYINLQFGLWFGKKFFAYTQDKFKERFSKTIVLQLIAFYLIAFIVALFFFLSAIYIMNYMKGNTNVLQVVKSFIDHEIKHLLIYYSIGILIGTLFFFYILWQETLKREQKLKEEKLIFQYETLKNQVNPHFLFNCLNTLSSLVYNNPDLSEEFITKLSSIYRYILENKDADLISLEKEVQLVKDYFHLQQIRDEKKIELIININDYKYMILPISLQILLENAFKHNMASRKKPLIITITKKNGAYITVENNLQEKNRVSHTTGTGLKNLAARVNLILNKKLEISKTSEKFIATIPLIKS